MIKTNRDYMFNFSLILRSANDMCVCAIQFFFFFWIRENLIFRKAHFVDPGERIKYRLFQALTRGARLDSNTRPAVQILSSLPSRYATWSCAIQFCECLRLHLHLHLHLHLVV
jgi:hypothetical protein